MSLSATGVARSDESSLKAIRTGTGDLERHVARGKAAAAGRGGDRVRHAGALHLLGIAAVGADQEEAAMRLAGMAAADEGVHPLDAVDQPVLDQEIERAIDGRRGRAEVLVAQLVEQRVGADR